MRLWLRWQPSKQQRLARADKRVQSCGSSTPIPGINVFESCYVFFSCFMAMCMLVGHSDLIAAISITVRFIAFEMLIELMTSIAGNIILF